MLRSQALIQLFVAMQAMQVMKSWMRAWDRGYSCGGGEYMYCSPLPQEPRHKAKTSIAALAERISFSECQRVWERDDAWSIV